MAIQGYASDAPRIREEPFFLRPIWWLGLPLALAVLTSVSAFFFMPWHSQWMLGELGIIEQLQLLALILALGVAARLLPLPEIRGRPWLRAWIALAVVSCIYTIGEEISYGQHFFGWETPEGLQAINQQQETNLHNISNWFNMKPRLLLELAAIVGGIIMPIVMRYRPSIRRHPAALILPTIICLPSALLAELVIFTKRVIEDLGLGTTMSFRLHAHEVQELYYYLFVLFYLLVLRHKIRTGEG